MNHRTTITALAFALVLAACHAPLDSVSSSAPVEDGGEMWTARESAAKQRQDLTIPAAPGSVRTADEPLRKIDGAPTGRVWLLEMYQSALKQRDEIAQRAGDMAHERDAALARAADAEKARADFEARNTGLALELKEAQSKSLELARRLAQSELARLESEKALLESRVTESGKTRSP
jgi:hypothetical protein